MEKNIIKWSNGSFFERSKRVYKNKEIENIEMEYNNDTNNSYNNNNDVVNECLNNELMINVINQPIFSRKDSSLNNREINFNKIHDREQYAQKGLNPFLENNNYLTDIDNSNKFLIYKNTTVEKDN